MGELTVFYGMPDTGKSTVAIDIAARMTVKKGFPDGSPCAETVSVLMMTTEDGQDTTIVPRLMVAGANLERVYFASKMNISYGDKLSQRMIALDTDLDILEQKLKYNPAIGLVVIESIGSYLGHGKKNEERDMRLVMDSLRELMVRRDCALIVIDHLNKNANQAALHRLGGSVSYGAAPRAIWLFAKDEEDSAKRLMLPMKLNIVADSKKIGQEYTFKSVPIVIDGKKTDRGAIEWLGVTHRSAEAVVSASSDPEAGKLRQAMDFYREKLADGPKLSHKLYDELEVMGISPRTAKRARQKLSLDAYQEGLKWWTAFAKDGAKT
jgi:putative DNA primase/helicase